jgi:Fe(3+) dicitrate transport protein
MRGEARWVMRVALALSIGASGGVAVSQEGTERTDDARAVDDAAEPVAGEGRSRAVTAPQVEVIGARSEDLDAVPGSAHRATEEDLTLQQPLSANEVLRTLPGVHVVDEDGLGLRPNIGFRGLDPDRSRSVLVLEDGVPISLAPYGEPEMYYNPPIERMLGVDVVKGSGSILFGPQTIGGVINYRTADPPAERRIGVDVRAGTFGYWMGQLSVGDTHGDIGYLLHALHKRYEGPRALDLRVTDLLAKLRLALDGDTVVGLKINVYDELSSATYLGLTMPQFEHDPRGSYARHDRLPVRRYSLSATLDRWFGDDVFLQTTVYGALTSRDWQRQDFDRTDGGRAYERIIDGRGRDVLGTEERPDDGSAIYFRQSTGNRNRSFVFAGVEPRVTVTARLGEVDYELQAGARFHFEQAEEQRIDGSFGASRAGTLREDELRTGFAVSAHALNRFIIADRLRLSPGLRVEAFWAEREIFQQRVEGTPTDLNPPVSETTSVFAWIPGLGVTWAPTDGVTLFTGVHRGFAPPRTKDAITSDGTNLELDAEFSWNAELGLRLRWNDVLEVEVAGFYLHFENQIIPPSESSGFVPGGGQPALVNSGETRHLGAEVSVRFDGARWGGADFRLPLTLAYTFVQAEFGEGWREDLEGNRLPYAPEHLLHARLAFVHPVGFSASVDGSWLSDQFADRENTEAPTMDGLVGRLDGRFLLDARLGYTHEPWGVSLFVAGKNLTDEVYIASRRPQGLMPGAPRQVITGISGTF